MELNKCLLCISVTTDGLIQILKFAQTKCCRKRNFIAESERLI